MNFIVKLEEEKKIGELIEITDLNLKYINNNFILNNKLFEQVGEDLIYHDNEFVAILQRKNGNLSLLVVRNEELEQITLDLDGSNTIKVVRYLDGEITKVVFGNGKLNISISNAMTFELESLLKTHKIKMNIVKPKTLEYQELTFELPVLITDEQSESDLFRYIPKCKSTIIHGDEGTEYETQIGDNNGTSIMRIFNISHSLLKSSILPKYKISNEYEMMNTPLDLTFSSSISYALKPLRVNMVKELYENFINSENARLKTYYLRYFDEIINGINYFQNEDKNAFYVFEDDIKKLLTK